VPAATEENKSGKPVRALITGGSGFVASYLADLLIERGYEVYAFSCGERGRLNSRVRFSRVDIRSTKGIRDFMQEIRPKEVYHLAAISSVPMAWKSPRQTFAVNVLGTCNLLDSACAIKPKPRILNVSTSQVYAPKEGELDETWPLGPANPYATSKAMAEMLVAQYANASGLHVITARSFNHSGPGQSSEFVLSSLARQVAEIELGLTEAVVRAGDLGVERDFSHVSDVVRAYCELLRLGDAGDVYNVSSGTCYSLAAVVAILSECSATKFEVRTDSSRLHSAQPRKMLGNSSKLRRQTGWAPTVSFRQLVTDLLQWWRVELRSKQTAEAMPR
jgi:GDP-4-dehydro-6-deoxy-D-mannose reductase